MNAVVFHGRERNGSRMLRLKFSAELSNLRPAGLLREYRENTVTVSIAGHGTAKKGRLRASKVLTRDISCGGGSVSRVCHVVRHARRDSVAIQSRNVREIIYSRGARYHAGRSERVEAAHATERM